MERKFYSKFPHFNKFLHLIIRKLTRVFLFNTIISLIRSFVGSLIDFPKPIVAVVNGPAIGIACTILGLMDAVYASDRVGLSYVNNTKVS